MISRVIKNGDFYGVLKKFGLLLPRRVIVGCYYEKN